MKALSLIVLTLLTLTACGDSATPEEKAEAEARQWVIDAAAELWRSDFVASDITSVTVEEFAACFLDKAAESSPLSGDSDIWQQAKTNALNPNFETSKNFDTEDEEFVQIIYECGADLLTAQELVRAGFIGD
ncbi:MAG: hypothetical protein P8J01_04810 [Acidimicrobiales bacterium]|nr:hypothetical protein [Acidimicrobiales bacterium]